MFLQVVFNVIGSMMPIPMIPHSHESHMNVILDTCQNVFVATVAFVAF